MSNNNKFLSDSEKCAYCDPKSPESTGSKDCIDSWRLRLKTTTEAYNEIAAQTAGMEKVYANMMTWEVQLKAWVDSADAAGKKAADIESTLKHFKALVVVLESSTSKTTDAIKAVLCLIKHIFDEICKLIQESTNDNDAKGLIQSLKEYIECYKGLDEQKKSEALKCVAAYEEKAKLLSDAQEATISKLLVMLQAAITVAKTMGNDDNQRDMGLHRQLIAILKRLGLEMEAYAQVKSCTSQHSSGKVPGPKVDPPFGDEMYEPKTSLLPIDKSWYYTQIKSLLGKAQVDGVSYKGALDTSKADRDRLLNQKNSLAKAIQASEDAAKAK